MNQQTNVIARNAFRLHASEAERFADVIARAMKLESAALTYAGAEQQPLQSLDLPPVKLSSQLLRRKQLLDVLHHERFQTTQELAYKLGRSTSSVNSVLTRMTEEGLVDREPVRSNVISWRKRL